MIIRGARQVGKTTLIKSFGSEYKQFIYLNLEKKKDRIFFELYDEVRHSVEALLLDRNLKTSFNNTLLFIDEIQELPETIHKLRYFYEELPDLHVIAAGSLLEFAMKDISSFPVGRVSFMYLHPLNFPEFLEACGEKQLVEELCKTPFSPPGEQILKSRFHDYVLTGGMPEVVSSYTKNKRPSALIEVYESIWETYKADVEKYAENRHQQQIIKHIMEAAPAHLDERITFNKFGNSNYKSREVAEAFRTLDNAGIIRIIYPTTDTEFPAKPDYKKKPRMQFLDTGLVNFSMGLHGQLIGVDDLSSAYKGALIPHVINQELLSLNKTSIKKNTFWVRDKKQSSAEVDLIVTYKDLLIPIEVKSGSTGKMRSLHQFMEQAPHDFAVRIYGGKLLMSRAETPSGKRYRILNLPYFLGTRIAEYIDAYFDQSISGE